jgi:phage gp37-like protein
MIPKGAERVVHYTAWDAAANAPKAGDAGNHSIYVIKDGAKAAASNSPSEIGSGLYKITFAANEMDGGFITLAGKSSTDDVYIIPVHMLTDEASTGVGRTVQYTAWDMSANAPKTGDAGSHSMSVARDASSVAATNSPSEIDATNAPGVYSLVLTDVEMNGVFLSVFGTSSTGSVKIMPTSFATDAGEDDPDPVSVQEFEQIEDKIIEELAAEVTYLRTVETYAGQLEGEIARMAVKFPAAFLVYGGTDLEEVDGPNHREVVRFSVLVAAKNLRSNEDLRKDTEGAYDLVTDVLAALTNNTFGLDIERLRPVKVSLVHIGKGIAVYGLDFQTSFDNTYSW